MADLAHQTAIVKLLSPYTALFPNCKLTGESLALYARSLDMYPLAVLQTAIEYVIRKSKFFPTVAELCETADAVVAQVKNGEKPTAGEAWEEVMTNARRIGTYGKWEYSCPEVEAAVKRFGKNELCSLEMSAVNTARAQFMRIYDSVLNRNTQKTAFIQIFTRLPKAAQAQLASIGGNGRLLGVGE